MERLRRTPNLRLATWIAAIEAGEVRGTWRVVRGRAWVIIDGGTS